MKMSKKLCLNQKTESAVQMELQIWSSFTYVDPFGVNLENIFDNLGMSAKIARINFQYQ